MVLLTPANFRPQTLSAACQGLALEATEASDADLMTEIASATQRINDYTGDQFESSAGLVLEHDVSLWSPRLHLLRRCTAVTTVKTRDEAGVLTTQSATVFRFHPSLDSTGAVRLGDLDYLDIVPGGAGLTGVDFAGYWPVGPQTVQVTGTFGWTVTPGDIKRACALMVWDVFKREGGDVRRASRWARGDLTVERATDSTTGLPEADTILETYVRRSFVGVG